jgi:porphyrinogen peroxidase
MIQRALLEPPPAVARILVFNLVAGRDPLPALKELCHELTPGYTVVGLGQPFIAALGREVPGLRPFPSLSASGIDVPSTQGALWVHLRAADEGEAFEHSRVVAKALSGGLSLAEEVHGFRYRDGRDLSGFVDGTANPDGDDAIDAAIVSSKLKGMNDSSFVAVQRWVHDLGKLEALDETARDHVIGRSMYDNDELDDAPASAHVKRTEQEAFHHPDGFMLRRSMPWGGVEEHGIYFVAFVESLDRYERSLRRMLGMDDRIVDQIFSFTRPVSGGYYWCPPLKDARLDLSYIGL